MVGSILQSTSSSACSLLKLPFHLEDLEVSPAAQARSQVHCLGQHRGKTQTANDGWWVQNVDVQRNGMKCDRDPQRLTNQTDLEDLGSRRRIEDCGSHGDVLLTGFTKGFIGGISSIYAQPYFDMLRC